MSIEGRNIKFFIDDKEVEGIKTSSFTDEEISNAVKTSEANMRTIQEQWESYKKDVLPKNAPQVQIKECRLAFYAGANVMLNATFEIGGESISEDAGVAILDGYHEEMELFYKDITKQ